ncbi:MAG: hypothetical protein KAI47_20410, partial [Deltaproteobacteria bacterium]|nr:hypothetical protein [Deltaproteobacteria bacterium]
MTTSARKWLGLVAVLAAFLASGCAGVRGWGSNGSAADDGGVVSSDLGAISSDLGAISSDLGGGPSADLGGTMKPNKAGCGAQAIQWNPCGGNLAPGSDGQTLVVNNTLSPTHTGSATYTCMNGIWTASGQGTCVAIATGCPTQAVQWGACSGQLNAGSDGRSQVAHSHSPGSNTVGSALYQCANGVWNKIHGTCGQKLCSYDWTNGGKTPTAVLGSFTKIYVMLTNRSPAPGGLAYWNRSGYSDQTIGAFASNQEPMAEFKNFTSAYSIIRHIYQTSFNRAPVSGGIDYWIGGFNDGSFSTAPNFTKLGRFVMAFYNGALGTDKTIINNKVSVGNYWARQLRDHR